MRSDVGASKWIGGRLCRQRIVEVAPMYNRDRWQEELLQWAIALLRGQCRQKDVASITAALINVLLHVLHLHFACTSKVSSPRARIRAVRVPSLGFRYIQEYQDIVFAQSRALTEIGLVVRFGLAKRRSTRTKFPSKRNKVPCSEDALIQALKAILY